MCSFSHHLQAVQRKNVTDKEEKIEKYLKWIKYKISGGWFSSLKRIYKKFFLHINPLERNSILQVKQYFDELQEEPPQVLLSLSSLWRRSLTVMAPVSHRRCLLPPDFDCCCSVHSWLTKARTCGGIPSTSVHSQPPGSIHPSIHRRGVLVPFKGQTGGRLYDRKSKSALYSRGKADGPLCFSLTWLVLLGLE